MKSFSISTEILIGLDSLKSMNFDRVFIVTDNFMKDKLHLITPYLDNASCEVFSDVTPDPDISIIQKGVAKIRDFKPNVVIALGGGSPIDAAKAIVFFANKAVGLQNCPFIAIPTTSGTGSEVTMFSVISDKEAHAKYPLVDKSLCPDVAILDANLTKTAPAVVTADTGIDVLVHAMEAFVSKNATDFSDALAEKSFKLAYKNLKLACDEPNNLKAREAMHSASCLAGMAFNNAGLGINHSTAHILGARGKLSHGRSNALMMIPVIQFNAFCASGVTSAAYRYEMLAENIGVAGYNTKQSVLNLIDALKKLISDINIPSTITKAGVNLDKLDLNEISKIALNDVCTASNPTTPTIDDIKRVFENAF